LSIVVFVSAILIWTLSIAASTSFATKHFIVEAVPSGGPSVKEMSLSSWVAVKAEAVNEPDANRQRSVAPIFEANVLW